MDQIFQNGERFRGYVVERLLGNGGLGAVYLVRHELMDRLYAMKILFPEVAEDNPEYVQRFVREARLAAKINHPNLVSVFDVGYDDAKGVYYLIMEYADGSNLRTAIAMGGAMSADEAVRIIASVAKALSAGEPFGLVHRDIKPENIMLENDGMVKLVDLGVAKACNTDSLNTVPQTVFGTPNYISPEQACDSSNVDSRADVYSLGVMLFEMLSGRRPYDCNDPRKVLATLLSPAPLPDVRTVAPTVPAPLAGVVAQMLAKAPEQRLSSASAVLKALSDAGYVSVDSDTSRSTANVRREEADFNFSDFDGRDDGDAPTFETQDVEMQKFVEASKAKRRRKELLSQLALPLAALAVAIAVLAAAIAYRM